MEKKFYENPSMEVLDLNVEGFFCASITGGESNSGNAGVDDMPEFDLDA